MPAALAAAASRLAAAGIEQPLREARLLLGHALGWDQETLLRRRDECVEMSFFTALLARRLTHEPLARIVGQREFWGLAFGLSPATLVPRPDSETLIEAALAAFPCREAVRRVLDLGTGSGCLLLAALSEFPSASGLGIDRSASACRCAARNATALGFGARAAFLCADWATAISGRFDLVLCNPPYIKAGEIAGLASEVARFDPPLALDGGEDGLAAYRAVFAALPAVLTPQGAAILELGFGQLPEISRLAAAAGLTIAEARADLAGIPRAVRMVCGSNAAAKAETARIRKKPIGEPMACG